MAALQGRIADLEKQAGDPALWEDTSSAQTLLQRLSEARETVASLQELSGICDDVDLTVDLAALEKVGLVLECGIDFVGVGMQPLCAGLMRRPTSHVSSTCSTTGIA